jgi:hypothetical protein
MRRDYGVMAAAEHRMEGGREDWHFVDRRDERDHRDAKKRIESIMKSLPERLTKFLMWGRQRGLEVAEDVNLLTNAKESSGMKSDTCGGYEADVRVVLNAILVEQVKAKQQPVGSVEERLGSKGKVGDQPPPSRCAAMKQTEIAARILNKMTNKGVRPRKVKTKLGKCDLKDEGDGMWSIRLDVPGTLSADEIARLRLPEWPPPSHGK